MEDLRAWHIGLSQVELQSNFMDNLRQAVSLITEGQSSDNVECSSMIPRRKAPYHILSGLVCNMSPRHICKARRTTKSVASEAPAYVSLREDYEICRCVRPQITWFCDLQPRPCKWPCFELFLQEKPTKTVSLIGRYVQVSWSRLSSSSVQCRRSAQHLRCGSVRKFSVLSRGHRRPMLATIIRTTTTAAAATTTRATTIASMSPASAGLGVWWWS